MRIAVRSANETKRPQRAELTGFSVESGGKRLVGPISLAVAAGECLVVCGQMGAGKSLLSEYLAGFRRPGLDYTGRLEWGDQGVLSDAGRVALAPQDWRLGALRTDRVKTVLAGRGPEVGAW